MLPIRFLCLFTAAMGLTGCATLSQEECLRGDWYGLGIQDGLVGHTSQRLAEHAKPCAEYGVAINQEAYFTGREQGLRDYCRLDNAFESGLRGQGYQHVCPPQIDGLFAHYHAAAYAVYQDRFEMERIGNELSSKESQLWNKKLSDAERSRIRDMIHDLDHNYHYLRDELYYHERQLERLRQEESRQGIYQR